MPSPDLAAQQLSSFQSGSQPGPSTIASAAVIAPTSFLTVITGTVAISNIVPPIEGTHLLFFLPTGALPVFGLAGNIFNAGAISTANVMFFAVYNPLNKKYYIMNKA